MRKVPLSLLRPGMVVARAVYSADGLTLLNRGKELKPQYIRRLQEQGISAVYVDDGFFPDVEVKDVISEQTRLRANKMAKEMLTNIELCARTGQEPKINQVLVGQTVSQIIEDLLASKDVMVNLADIRAVDDYTFAHSVNVCVLAILTAVSLHYEQRDLVNLGVGALLHDVGKVKVPASVLNKPGKLSPREFEEIKRHPGYGFEMLKNQLDINGLSAKVSYQHHEKFDGSGYPLGLKADSIHEFARIVGIVDVFDALTADRVYRKAYQPYEAFELIAGSGNYLFEYRLVKAFLDNVALYPVGTMLRLSNGHAGLVIDNIKGMSHRPSLRVLFDLEGRLLGEPYDVKLSESTGLYIDRVIAEEEYRAMTDPHRKTVG